MIKDRAMSALDGELVARRVRIAIAALAAIVWFAPWRPNTAVRLMTAAHDFGLVAAMILFLVWLIPFFGALLGLAGLIGWAATRLADAVLFSLPRLILRRAGLGVLASFILAFALEAWSVRAGVHWLRREFAPQGPILGWRTVAAGHGGKVLKPHRNLRRRRT